MIILYEYVEDVFWNANITAWAVRRAEETGLTRRRAAPVRGESRANKAVLVILWVHLIYLNLATAILRCPS